MIIFVVVKARMSTARRSASFQLQNNEGSTRRSPRRLRTKTPSVNELSKKYSKYLKTNMSCFHIVTIDCEVRFNVAQRVLKIYL